MKPRSTAQILRQPDGCDVADRCVDCPLRECRFEDRSRWAKRRRQAQDVAIAQLISIGVPAATIATHRNTTERTIYRALERVRQEHPDFTPGELHAILRTITTPQELTP